MNNELIKKIKLQDIDVNSFYKSFLSEKEPILITDIFEQLPSLENWSTEYLVDKVGNKIIKVNISDDGVFDVNHKTGELNFRSENINFRKYIDIISKKNSKKKMYAQNISILREFPELRGELELIDYIPNKLLHSANLWLGPGGNTTPMHFDYYNNFFIQLLGEKKIWLYSPEYFYSLYPYSWKSEAPFMSRVNPAKPDYNKYPNALKAKKIEITVSRGNILYLPSYWWHQVYSINTSISVNIWSEPSFKQKLVVAHFHSFLNSIFTTVKSKVLGAGKFFEGRNI